MSPRPRCRVDSPRPGRRSRRWCSRMHDRSRFCHVDPRRHRADLCWQRGGVDHDLGRSRRRPVRAAGDDPPAADPRLQSRPVAEGTLALSGPGAADSGAGHHGALPADRARRGLGGAAAGGLHGRLLAVLRAAGGRRLRRPALRALQPCRPGALDLLLQRAAARVGQPGEQLRPSSRKSTSRASSCRRASWWPASSTSESPS